MTKIKGFTLLEMLVVITIVGVLATAGIATYQAANRKSRNGQRQAEIEEIRSGLEMYKADIGNYPTSYTPASGLVSGSVTYIGSMKDPLCEGASCIGGHSPYAYSSPTGASYTVTAYLEPSGTYVKQNP